MTDHYALALVAVVSAVTVLLRCLPFWVFGGDRKTPKLIDDLGKLLPFAIIGMLVVYCLKDISFTGAPFGLPELIASAAVVGLHLWKRNTLLSIGGATLLYMLLVQVVFSL